MIVEYKVYRKKGDTFPMVSYNELPAYAVRGRQKYVGKKAKIETIFRLTNKLLPMEWKTKQVDDYVAENFYKKPIWRDYCKTFREVSIEREVVSDSLTFQYSLIVTFQNQLEVSVDDERVIHLIICELMGTPLSEYEGLSNTIVSLEKHYN